MSQIESAEPEPGGDRMQAEGIVDQVADAVQQGLGKARTAVGRLIDEAPAALSTVADRGRDLTRRGDQAIRTRIGDAGSLYVTVGLVGMLALGAVALVRSRSAAKPASQKNPAVGAGDRQRPLAGSTAGRWLVLSSGRPPLVPTRRQHRD